MLEAFGGLATESPDGVEVVDEVLGRGVRPAESAVRRSDSIASTSDAERRMPV